MAFGDDLLTSAQVALILGCSIATVNRRAVAGDLPVAQQLPGPTGARLFRRGDIEALRPAERAAMHPA